ncbi:ICMT-domain-containing protein [Ganoderma leucocontextum]|nr:ICMT-domain-containing protein [Ganoderma leucocontextum]
MNFLYLAKVPAFAMIMVAENTSFRPPNNPSPKNEDHHKFGKADLITSIASWFPPFGVTVNFCFHLCEVAAVLAREFPSPLSDRVLVTLFQDRSNVNRLAISPTFAVGFLLLVLGAAWRKRCYDTLGKFFTFQLALNKEHRLVTTGPYAIVRHPAYTAFIMTDVGCLMTLMLPGSYMYESGMLKAPWVAVCAALWAMVHVAISLTAVKRVPVEDAVMRKEFGSEWDAWARKTPYALIPYIY